MHQKQQNWCILSVIYNGQIGITLEMELHWLNAKNPVLDGGSRWACVLMIIVKVLQKVPYCWNARLHKDTPTKTKT